MSTNLNGWHPGELAIQSKLGYTDTVTFFWRYLESTVEEDFRHSNTKVVHFVPLTTLDERGRPWAGIMAAKDGLPGFGDVLADNRLVWNVQIWKGDPLNATVDAWAKGKHERERFLVAGLGLELETRKRNKFAGWLQEVKQVGEGGYVLDMHVQQAVRYAYFWLSRTGMRTRNGPVFLARPCTAYSVKAC
jgi:hypothetical protein